MTTTPHRVGADELERQVIYNINEDGWHAVNVIEDDGHPPGLIQSASTTPGITPNSSSSGPTTMPSIPGTKKHLGRSRNGSRYWEQYQRSRDLPILSPYIIVRRYFLDSDHDHRDTDQQGPNHHSSRGARGARGGCRRSCG